MDLARIINMSEQAALQVYVHPPDEEYSRAAANLLLMTVAHESDGFRARRQYGPYLADDDERGAFGLWQIEYASLSESLEWIWRNKTLRRNCIRFLGTYGFDKLCVSPASNDEVAWLIQQKVGDPVCCMLARVHYLRRPGRIPSDLMDAAKYAKDQYNTRKGSATPDLYFEAFMKFFHARAN